MWSCHKCGKPVFFAERKQSMGYDFHPDCLKCQECGKVLKPGQHAEHKGVPYCHVPCYGALFGPQLFGHGTRVESHKSFGKVENKSYGGISRIQLENTIKSYNHYYEVHGGSGGVKSREVNGRLVLEGVLKLYWGLHSAIQLKEEDDQRLLCNNTTPKYQRRVVSNGIDFQNSSFACDDSDSSDDSDTAQTNTDKPHDTDLFSVSNGANTSKCSEESSSSVVSERTSSGDQVNNDQTKYKTVPSKLDTKQLGQWDELDELLVVEREWKENEKPYQTLPNFVAPVPSTQVDVCNGKDTIGTESSRTEDRAKSPATPTSPSHPQGKGTALRRRPGRRFDKAKVRRRCSINGHYYNRETSVFTPPYGSSMSVWTTSLVSTQEVINMLLDKYRVQCPAVNFTILIVKDNGERRRVRDDEYPLLLRVMQGPDETVAKLFLVESGGEDSQEVSAAVAQFLHLSSAECTAILRLYNEEEEREIQNIKNKHRELKRRIKKRMQDLKVKL